MEREMVIMIKTKLELGPDEFKVKSVWLSQKFKGTENFAK